MCKCRSSNAAARAAAKRTADSIPGPPQAVPTPAAAPVVAPRPFVYAPAVHRPRVTPVVQAVAPVVQAVAPVVQAVAPVTQAVAQVVAPVAPVARAPSKCALMARLPPKAQGAQCVYLDPFGRPLNPPAPVTALNSVITARPAVNLPQRKTTLEPVEIKPVPVDQLRNFLARFKKQ